KPARDRPQDFPGPPAARRACRGRSEIEVKQERAMRPERYLAIGAMIAVAMGIAPVRAGTIQVTIDKLVYSPAEVKVRVGDTIEWVNKDVLAHTATVKG